MVLFTGFNCKIGVAQVNLLVVLQQVIQSYGGKYMKLRTLKPFRSIVAAGCVSLLAATGIAKAADSTQPIVIPIHNWSSQVVMAYVIGGMFETMGSNVEYVTADSQAVYESIRTGDVTISHEVWQSTFGKSFLTAVEKGGVIDAGTHSATTLEETR